MSPQAESRADDGVPRVSAVLVAGANRRRAARALQSLLSQAENGGMEILLSDLEPDAPSLAGADRPAVRRLPTSGSMTYTAARTAAVHAARGEIVAFLEEHAVALPGWLPALEAAFAEGPWSGVGPEMHNANPGRGISNAVALMNYLDWRAPAMAGPSTMLPGHNSAYRRRALLACDADLPVLLQSEVLLQWRMRQTGGRLTIAPTVRVAHLNEGTLAAICRGYYHWNRCFAPTRARLYCWPPLKKFLRLCATPLLPLVKTLKTARYLRRRAPRALPELLRALPVLLIAWSATAWGQAMGIAFGPGNAEVHFSDYELNVKRPESAE